VDYWSERHELPAYVVWAQIGAESAYNPRAVSPVGARGLMQIMPATAEWIAGQIGGPYDSFNCDDNIRMGTWYDAWCLSRVNLALKDREATPEDRWRFMLASYNAGPGYVLAGLKILGDEGAPTATWPLLASVLPRALVKGRHADIKQVTEYVQRIMPNAQAAEG
jgi:soluble lytic murein transglycosylase-like protein